MPNQALDRAIKAVGSQEKLALAIGAYQSKISFWLTSAKGGVPGEYCVAIEAATGVSRHDLRPDIFGPAPALQATEAVA